MGRESVGGQQQEDRLATLEEEVRQLRREQDELYSVLDTIGYLLARRVERALAERRTAESYASSTTCRSEGVSSGSEAS